MKIRLPSDTNYSWFVDGLEQLDIDYEVNTYGCEVELDKKDYLNNRDDIDELISQYSAFVEYTA